ncbi:MAG: hypothetical protein LiPW15_54 [Parcubacteria group bacterium LiPW_15]|nr:MAG: hypothetical protein LiPW15_54 [Parcubacteria group bacterium LiPW_15]
MSVFKLAVQFEGESVRLGYDILHGVWNILFVAGDFSLKPGNEFLIVVRDDVQTIAIATVGKVGLLPMTASEARHIEAVVPTQDHNGNGGIEARIFTEIHIGDVETLTGGSKIK